MVYDEIRYRWKRGFRCAVDAQTAGERMEEIRQRHHGALLPGAVVRDARSEDSPLHPAFEWRDEVAGEHWRIVQARRMMRNVVVYLDGAEDVSQPQRVFVNIQKGEAQFYTTIMDAVLDPDGYAYLVGKALAEFERWQQRYRELPELARIFAAAEEVRVELLNASQEAA